MVGVETDQHHGTNAKPPTRMKTERDHSSPVLVAAVLALACVLAFAPDAYMPMLVRAFLFQWVLFFVVLAALLAWKRQWWSVWASLSGAIFLLLQVSTPCLPQAGAVSGTSIRVLHMNVLQPNMSTNEVVGEALKSGADIISVQEVDAHWAHALEAGLRSAYPYSHIEARSNCYGIALFSRLPFAGVATIAVLGSPCIEALFDVNGSLARVISVHASSPISYGHFQLRNKQLDCLAQHVGASDTATILVGDLNTVPWDKAFARFCARAGLRSTTSMGQRTWPSVGPWALIPLDHLMLSHGTVPASIHTFHVPGSDHRGLLAEVIIPKHAP